MIVRQLREETVVYDLASHEAHCLNPTAALVWEWCDGETAVPEMTRRLGERLGTPVRDEIVWGALRQLGRARLLEGKVEPPRGKGVSRRELLKTSTLAAAMLPVVVSLVAPTPAVAAFTCNPPNCIASNACRPTIDLCQCCGPPNCVKKCDATGNCSNAVGGC